MSKHRAFVGRFCVDGWHRAEVSEFLLEAALCCVADPHLSPVLEDVPHVVVSRVPTPCARNAFVEEARNQRADFIFMVDDDMGLTPGFFKIAMQWMLSNPPCAIGVPYVSGGSEEKVHVFEVSAPRNDENAGFLLTPVSRADAPRRTGIEQVANIGTGCIGYNMRVFDLFEAKYGHRIWFDYTYNQYHTEVVETEDCWLHRHLFQADIPVYVSWDHWGTHFKERGLTKPKALEAKDVHGIYLDQARGVVQQQSRLNGHANGVMSKPYVGGRS